MTPATSTLSRRVRIYVIVVESILAVAITAILALAIYSFATGSVTHEELNEQVVSLQQQVTILNCQINADDPAELAVCDSLIEAPTP